MEKTARFIISGGGTGGHIFPAISIADEIKKHYPEAEILFVGAEGRMEMEKVPAAGYKIVGLPVSGLKRSLSPANLKVLFNFVRSIRKAKKIIRDFKPDAAIGVGGYASAPLLYAASKKGVPTLIQEQNSYAGLTNKMLGKRVDKICVAYDDMDRFFPAAKIIKTGNPVRSRLAEEPDKAEAYAYFGLDPSKRTILAVGGSLGARTINRSILAGIESYAVKHASDMQLIWQTGKFYIDDIRRELEGRELPNVVVTDFVSRMDLAYAIADLVISRAGASSISELSMLGKACILVPSPNVAEDHQTKNAMALKERRAAELIPDKDAPVRLVPESIRIAGNDMILSEYRKNILYFARPDAAFDIACEAFRLASLPLPEKKKASKPAKKAAAKEAPKDKPEAAEINEPKAAEEKQAAESDAPKNYYFLGIGGIGMSAIARYLKRNGHEVAGYDLTETPLTRQLEAEGMDIHYEDSISRVPIAFMNNENTIVIYTPAIPADMKELQFFRKGSFTMMKRAEALGHITRGKKAICVAGSHGKTTTTTMIAHIMNTGEHWANAFLGGISKNYGSNLIVAEGSDIVVAEADEYDRSFLQLSPRMAVVTATDNDHLDVYGTRENMLEAYSQFCSRIEKGGVLVYKKGIDLKLKLQDKVKAYTYSAADEEADFYASNVRISEGAVSFDFCSKKGSIKDIRLGTPALVNVENAVAAIAIGTLNKVGQDDIKKAIESFRGASRRFDMQYSDEGCVYIDDYAHHPNEIEACLRSARELYPGKKICAVFQPHLYSRTRDFYEQFAAALSKADSVILLDIYPAREKPIEGVSSQLIYDRLTCAEKSICSKEELINTLKDKQFDLLITMGAGNIDAKVAEVAEYLKHRND